MAQVTLIRDQWSGQLRGFGFVEVPNDGDASRAVQALNGQDFMGSNVVVNEARPKESSGGRGGCYGGGGKGRGGQDRGSQGPGGGGRDGGRGRGDRWPDIVGFALRPGYQMRELADSCGVKSRTIFTGPLYNDQKKSALVDCDVFVLPSRYENFANSIAEAIACDRPVIISDQCGISEFVAGKAGLVIPRELPTLIDAMSKMVNDRALYDNFQAACPAVAARLSWREMLNVQETLYRRALGSASASG